MNAKGHAIADGQLVAIVDRLNDIVARIGDPPSSTVFSLPEASEDERALVRQPRLSLPDPRLVRRMINQRRQRNRYLKGVDFADPAWDILLELTAARALHERISVKSLCIASGVPSTTALRWIAELTENGWIERSKDDGDKRRSFVSLTDKGARGMARYFNEIVQNQVVPI